MEVYGVSFERARKFKRLMQRKERKKREGRGGERKGTKYFAGHLRRSLVSRNPVCRRSTRLFFSASPSLSLSLSLSSPPFAPPIFSRLLIGRPVNCAFHKALVWRFTRSFSAAKEHKCARHGATRRVRRTHACVRCLKQLASWIYRHACIGTRVFIRIRTRARAHVQRSARSCKTCTIALAARRSRARVYTRDDSSWCTGMDFTLRSPV